MKALLVMIFMVLLASFAIATPTNDEIKTDGELFIFSGGDLYTYAPNSVLKESEVQVSLLFYDKEVKDFEGVLSNKGVEIANLTVDSGNEGTDSFVLFTWDLFIEENTSLDLEFNFDNELVYTKEINIEARDRKVLNTESDFKEMTITNDNPELIPNLRAELSKAGIDVSQEEFYGMMALADELVTTDKTVSLEKSFLEGDQIKTEITTTIDVREFENLEIFVVEFIDKSIAENTSVLEFNIKPQVLKEDPLIMWHLEEDKNEELSYTVRVDGEEDDLLTGNTVVLARTTAETETSKIDFLKTVIPLALIPVVAFIIIYFGNVNINKKKKKK